MFPSFFAICMKTWQTEAIGVLRKCVRACMPFIHGEGGGDSKALHN